MHRLLQRQLKKCRGTPDVPPEWAAFVEAVDLAYAQADADRELIERSMELSSQELVERNAELLGRNTELSAMREAALDCIISIDQAGRVVDFNPAAESTFGYSRREVVGRELAELIVPPRFREAHRQGIARYLRDGDGKIVGNRIEIEAMRRDGSELFVEMAVTVLPVPGEPVFTAYLRDVTARHEAEAALREEKRTHEAINNSLGEGVCTIDHAGKLTFVNPAAQRMLGAPADQLLGRDVYDVLRPTADGTGEFAFGAEPDLRRDDLLFARADGSSFPVACTCCPIHENGRPDGAVITFADVTDSKRAQWLERDRARLLEMVAENRPLADTLRELVLMVERQLPHLRASVLLMRDGRLWHGAAPNLSKEYVEAIDGVPVGRDVGLCGSAVHERRVTVCESLATDPRWSSYRALAQRFGLGACWSVPFFSGGGDVLGTFALYAAEPRAPKKTELALLDTSGRLAAVAVEHYQLTDRLAHQARHDPLTALPNRMLLEDRLNVAIARARRAPGGDEQIGVFFIDLDGFKLINDTLGHHCGDLLLKQITQRLQTTTREADTLARMGGDEFTLVAPAINSRAEADHIARRMLAAIGAPFILDGRELTVTASVGVAIYPHDGEDCAALQRNADAAMYRAKEMGRNTFEYFNPIMNVQAMERLELESMLRRALAGEELTLHYQPQLGPDGVVGFEALLRWHHPKLGPISPARFIPVAESTGLILPIGTWVLQQACRQAKRWQSLLGRPLHMSVNVSSLQFAQPGLVKELAEALRASELAPGLLELELTESVLMHRYGSAAVTLEQVRNLGVGVAIDDFGTGYSSLAYLDRLPIDTLKIDQTFVQEVRCGKAGEADGRDAILRAISSLAHNLNLKLVGEGVETDAQRRFLRHLGCHIMQGHLFSPAVPAEQIPPLVARLDAQFADRKLKQPA